MKKRIAAAFASWALGAACGNGSGSPSAAVSAAQACADNAHHRCLQLQACSMTDLQLRYGDEGTCEARETYSCTAALAEPLNGNTAAAVEACAGAYAGWTCDDYLSSQNIPPACQQQLGPVVNGGPCAVDGECASGFCAVAPGSPCGTCDKVPVAGASCAQLTSCGPTLACTADTFHCVVLGTRGAACGRGASCGPGFSCVGQDVTTGALGTCQRASETAGTVCDPSGNTGSGCDRSAGLVCNSTSKTCQSVVIASASQPCGDDVGGQPIFCQADGVCRGATATTPGKCTAAAPDGAACDLANGPGCVIPARCIGNGGTAGTCQYSGDQSCGG